MSWHQLAEALGVILPLFGAFIRAEVAERKAKAAELRAQAAELTAAAAVDHAQAAELAAGTAAANCPGNPPASPLSYPGARWGGPELGGQIPLVLHEPRHAVYLSEYFKRP